VRHIASKNWMILSLKAQRSLYIPPVVTIYTVSGHYMYRLGHYIYHQWSLYIPPVVTICTTSGHYMYRHSSLYVPPVVTLCTASGHYMYRQWSLYVPTLVTICTASLTSDNSTFCLRSVFTRFVLWISEQTAIISLYNINILVCITETESPVSLRNTSLRSTSSVLTQYSHSVFSRSILT
jgi:hypothetical protein